MSSTIDRTAVAAPALDQERVHRKQRLAAAFRLFARFGLYEGAAGHISARDPERADHYWLNPLDVHWGYMRTSDLVLVGRTAPSSIVTQR